MIRVQGGDLTLMDEIVQKRAFQEYLREHDPENPMRAMGDYVEALASSSVSSGTCDIQREQAVVLFEDQRLAAAKLAELTVVVATKKAEAEAIVAAKLAEAAVAAKLAEAVVAAKLAEVAVASAAKLAEVAAQVANDERLANVRREKVRCQALIEENKAKCQALIEENKAKIEDMASARRISEARAESDRKRVDTESKVLVLTAETQRILADKKLVSLKRKLGGEPTDFGAHMASSEACKFFHQLHRVTGENVEHVCVYKDCNGDWVTKGDEMRGLLPSHPLLRPDGVVPGAKGVKEVWEFHGNRFHGYPPGHALFNEYIGVNNIPASQLYEATAAKMDLFAKDYTVRYVWEHEYKECTASKCPRSIKSIIRTWTPRSATPAS